MTSQNIDNAQVEQVTVRSQGQTRLVPGNKYRPFPSIELPERQWPSRSITTAPTWCSVDLRDGNQALPTPMSVEEKLRMFDLLVKVGFKEIEIGFPSASQIEYDFIRRLVDENRVPDDVTVQVITQSREDLIRRTFESIRGLKKVIVHLYNSTSPAQRRLVFGLDKAGIVDIATRGTKLIKELVATVPETEITLQYSPESFALTEIDFSLEICEAVVDIWQPTPTNKIILNLPETVQIATPNVYADQIEWFCRHMRDRNSAIISLHTHNDRGTGVATTELGLMAGATRVEGTLFGNGERTGNVDIVVVALNMHMQGLDSHLDFSDLDSIRVVYEECTRMQVPMRQPYAGELVFTAFSGSHQDAIQKGMAAWEESEGGIWDVPYLPIDPKDIGRSYEAIIRINSQSGKGGVAYIMETEYGFHLPKPMRVEFGKVINVLADASGEELPPQKIYEAFMHEYIDRNGPFVLEEFHTEKVSGEVECRAHVSVNGAMHELQARGNGPIDAFVRALNEAQLANFSLLSYTEHSLKHGSDAQAIAYIQIEATSNETNTTSAFFGAAIETNIEMASIKSVISALNRSQVAGA
ncbi:2-isopropylmalate synthase [Ktedonospora formicarum]|uniref:2-isopropylmalate synthase n=1 Tax=Ktedonospora formicarum TaxID=2778364 RepID=A0A8J3HYQ9_9CHLR|nr:2-isopropylmalate synthase [Ktedonospora formicarum]GHO46199.1 2-isopropylmalate synthase [Ktedonospora formicarum]